MKFNWQKITSLDDAQESANNGDVVVICGCRTNEALSGHISVVAPESEKCKAIRKNGKVTLVVTSMAGGRNIKLGNFHEWYLGGEFKEYGIWKFVLPKPEVPEMILPTPIVPEPVLETIPKLDPIPEVIKPVDVVSSENIFTSIINVVSKLFGSLFSVRK